MRQTNTLLLFFALALLAGCSKNDKVVIYATARSGGWLWARTGPEHKNEEYGGYAALKKAYDLERGPKLAVDMGNWFGETPEGYLTKGRSTIECMHSVPYALSSLGPEDLTLPPKDLDDLAGNSGFPVIASNLYLKTNKKPVSIKSQYVASVGKAKIGFLSVVIMDPAPPKNPRYLPKYKFVKESYEIERSVKALKEAGADIMVLLLNTNAKNRPERGFYDSFFSRLPRLDLVITDDPGLRKPLKIKKSRVIPAPPGIYAAARIELSIDPLTRRLLKTDYKLLRLEKAKYGQDAGTLEIVEKHRSNIRKHFSKRIGTARTDLVRAEKNTESSLGNFTADCVKRWSRSNGAIINNAILSGDISSGPVTVGDLYRVLPYDTSVVFVKIRGEDLKRAVEEMIDRDISLSGLEAHLKNNSMDQFLVEGEQLMPNRIYRVAAPDSIVNDKDYTLLSSATEFANSRRYLREVIGWCFSRNQVALAPGDARIKRSQ